MVRVETDFQNSKFFSLDEFFHCEMACKLTLITVIDHLASKLNIYGYLIFERVCLLKITQDKHRP